MNFDLTRTVLAYADRHLSREEGCDKRVRELVIQLKNLQFVYSKFNATHMQEAAGEYDTSDFGNFIIRRGIRMMIDEVDLETIESILTSEICCTGCHSKEAYVGYIAMVGILSIYRGENKLLLEDRLNACIPRDYKRVVMGW